MTSGRPSSAGASRHEHRRRRQTPWTVFAPPSPATSACTSKPPSCTCLADVLDRRLRSDRPAGGASTSHGWTPGRLPGELAALAQELTVPETYFFRNRDQFRAFAEVALPDRAAARAGERRLNLLSAGCASGEEAYSLAIVAAGGGRSAPGPSRSSAWTSTRPCSRRPLAVGTRRGPCATRRRTCSTDGSSGRPRLRARRRRAHRRPLRGATTSLEDDASCGTRTATTSSSAATCSCTSRPSTPVRWSPASPPRWSPAAICFSGTPRRCAACRATFTSGTRTRPSTTELRETVERVRRPGGDASRPAWIAAPSPLLVDERHRGSRRSGVPRADREPGGAAASAGTAHAPDLAHPAATPGISALALELLREERFVDALDLVRGCRPKPRAIPTCCCSRRRC